MNTGDNIRMQSQKSPEQLEHEIDRQRDHIGQIVQALEQRFSPGELIAGAFGRGKDGGREFASNLAHTVQANPVPALITAAGLVWLYAGQGHPRSAEAGSHGRMSEKLGDARQRAGEKAHGAMDSMRDRAHRANDGFQHMLEHNPMAVGAMAIAAGALLGSLLPSTRREDELMGETRDHLAEKARRAMEGGMDQMAQAGREVGTPVQHAATDSQGIQRH